eukprot:1555341-Prymnesium_polylepis.1
MPIATVTSPAPLPSPERVLALLNTTNFRHLISGVLTLSGLTEKTIHGIDDSECSDAHVAALQRVGHCVTRIDEYTLVVYARGYALTARQRALIDDHARKAEFEDSQECTTTVFYPRTVAIVRMRGLAKCVPRLLGWLRAARIVLDDPRRNPAALAKAMAEFEADMDRPLHRIDKAASAAVEKQRSLKRRLHTAQFASPAETMQGVRWAGICIAGADGGERKRVRIRTVVDDVYVFETPDDGKSSPYSHDVLALRGDAFEVDWVQREAAWSGAGLEGAYGDRFRGGGDESDEDEESDE